MSQESTALAALLVAGHALGDFVFQTGWMVRRKSRPSGLLAHVAVVAVCQAALLAPFLSRTTLGVVLAIAGGHLVIDLAKTAVNSRAPSFPRTWFVLDQLFHLAVLFAAWIWLAPRVAWWPALALTPEQFTIVGVLVATYAFNVNGVSALVELELARLGISLAEGGPAAGRVIGILERVFAITLILLDRWEALGFLVAAKSLARFKELDDRRRAEYYLVGTLVSVLGATLSALLARALLARL